MHKREVAATSRNFKPFYYKIFQNFPLKQTCLISMFMDQALTKIELAHWALGPFEIHTDNFVI